jgi:hypothetical protein
MDQKKNFGFVAAGIVAFLLGGCSFSASTPTTFLFPTPNLTMSKLFEVPTAKPRVTAAGSATVPGQSTATISPTAPNCTTLMSPGSAFMKTWTLKNVGTCQWGKGYALVFVEGNPMGGPAEIPFTASVPAGAVYTFAVNLVAPQSEGEYKGYWMIQTPQGIRFGVEPDGKTAFGVSIAVAKAPGCAAQDRRPEENGIPLQAVFAVIPPVLDAKLPEWEVPLPFSLTHISAGDTENGARVGFRWDDKYLYFAVRVTDDTFVQETSGAANLLQGDAVEILLDANLRGDYCDSMLSGDDYQLGISPGYLQDPRLQGPTAYLFYPQGKRGLVKVDVAGLLTKSPDMKGWVLEARISWDLFGISPKGGESYGFVFSVSDNDQFGTVNQDGMLSTSPRRTSPPNPALWGTLQILPASGG